MREARLAVHLLFPSALWLTSYPGAWFPGSDRLGWGWWRTEDWQLRGPCSASGYCLGSGWGGHRLLGFSVCRNKFVEFDMKPVCKRCYEKFPLELKKRLKKLSDMTSRKAQPKSVDINSV